MRIEATSRFLARPRVAAAWVALFLLEPALLPGQVRGTPPATVTIATGELRGTLEGSGVRSFKGIPFAAPPVGQLRWQGPAPITKWSGIRDATTFGNGPGPRLTFRSPGRSEDCLYLNVWTPATRGADRLPVLVYFHGGGFGLGDGSEPRHDGERLARSGVVVVTANSRQNIFGFFAHPELTARSPHRASGNYGLMDQAMALRWVRDNIATFGGDSARVTLAGHSSGATAVSAHMVSPLSRDLFTAAIGSSGALFVPSVHRFVPLQEAERLGQQFAQAIGAGSLDELLAIPGDRLFELRRTGGLNRALPVAIDGYFLRKSPLEAFRAGEQARVPLLLGWAGQEQAALAALGQNAPTPDNFRTALGQLFGDRAGDAFNVYRASTDVEVTRAAADLAGDLIIAYPMWKWSELHRETGHSLVFRYVNLHPAPARSSGTAGPRVPVHGDDIDYVFGNLTGAEYSWSAEDESVRQLLHDVFVNFIKRRDPNGSGVPAWPSARGQSTVQVLYISAPPRVSAELHRERYKFLDSYYQKP